MTYTNPVVTDLLLNEQAIIALSALVYAIASLPSRLRNWRTRQRVLNAAADDFEDQVRARIELRRLLLDHVRSGELDMRPDEISDDFLDKVLDATAALGPGQLSIDRLELPERS